METAAKETTLCISSNGDNTTDTTSATETTQQTTPAATEASATDLSTETTQPRQHEQKRRQHNGDISNRNNRHQQQWRQQTSAAMETTDISSNGDNRHQQQWRQQTSAAMETTDVSSNGDNRHQQLTWAPSEEKLQELEDEVTRTREVENNPTQENISFKACTAKYRKASIQAARTSWMEKTEKLNLDKDGNKLWKLTKAMNNEETRSAPVTLQKDQEMVTGREAANCFIDGYEQINISVPEDRKRVHEEIKNHRDDQDQPDYMDRPFKLKELEAVKSLKDNSPGPDKVSNEMLKHLGTKAKTKLLALFNNSWKTGHVPQSWREAEMVPIQKKGKDKARADSYRPISLTSCVGKLLERMINSRLVWHLEKNIITPKQAGFRQHHSAEDQVTYIAQKIEDGFQEKQHTLAV
ncbi:hypothetical protein ACOMHN_061847 [Nucella lapillus]